MYARTWGLCFTEHFRPIQMWAIRMHWSSDHVATRHSFVAGI